jgi:hypothetical protein
MATNSGEIIQKGPIEIDRNFFVPPNVVDVRQLEETDITSGDIQSADDIETDIIDVSDQGDVSYVGLPVVDSITIVSQTVKTSTGGQVTVDVIIEVPDTDSIVNYDVRVTKL